MHLEVVVHQPSDDAMILLQVWTSPSLPGSAVTRTPEDFASSPCLLLRLLFVFYLYGTHLLLSITSRMLDRNRHKRLIRAS